MRRTARPCYRDRSRPVPASDPDRQGPCWNSSSRFVYFITHVNVVLADGSARTARWRTSSCSWSSSRDRARGHAVPARETRSCSPRGSSRRRRYPAGETGLNVWLFMAVFGLGAFVGDNVQLLVRLLPRARASCGTRTAGSSGSRTWTRRSTSTRSTARAPSSWPASSRSCARSRRSWPASAACPTSGTSRSRSIGTVLWVGTFTLAGLLLREHPVGPGALRTGDPRAW